MIILLYGLHIIQDYLTIHEVSPFAPVWNKNIKVGFFRSVPAASWYSGKEKGISENYFLILNFVVVVIILLVHFFNQ